ncbi:MAG: phosphomannomutase [Rhodospirillaceae bacterium]|jgi:phosphomannomutase|nr:phosphomannomutase [Rhodospirillaceae bacterium]|tara:strand:- start:2075 stop:3466 length:1392 start_codon:yes stop_codon:yes gene_type:complete
MPEGHRLDPTILREYDIRGIVPETLNEADVHAIGRAFGSILLDRGGKSAAVGYDGRLTSPELEAALVEGLSQAGIGVVRIGLGPTPMLYYAERTLGVDAGLMVTGSHNPPEHNGIKLVIGGKPFFAADIRLLGDRAAAGGFAEGDGKVEEQSVFDDYAARLLRDFEPGEKPLKVAWDAGNGATGEVLRKITKGLPGGHVLLNDEIDGTFPAHHPDPTVESNLEQLKQAVADHRCDLGIAFDGDGDRIGVIDGLGRVLWGDQLLVILAREVLDDQPGATIIADVKSSRVFFDEIARMGGQPLMWKTGHSHIKNKMAEIGAPLGGEMSAHIFFKHRYYGFDDALYVAVRLLSALNRSADSLGGIYDRLPAMVNTPELRFDCAEDRKFAVIGEVRERLGDEHGITVHDIDGVRVETEDGWWLLRVSNTQAALVARCESATPEGLERLKDRLRAQLEASGLALPVTD